MFSLPFFPIRNVFYMQALLPGCPCHQVRHFSTQISYSSLKYQFEPFKIPCIYLLNMIHVDFSLWTFQVHLSQLYNSLFQEFKVCINSELDLMIGFFVYHWLYMYLFSCKIVFVKCQTLWKFTQLNGYCEVNCTLEVQV